MTRQRLILLAAAGSAAMLLSAWAFQYIGGLAPCTMCIWQRWPHAAAAVIGLPALAVAGPLLPLLGALAAATTGGIGIYHTGVERNWWQGPTTCTSGGVEGLSPQELMDQIMAAPLVQCDQVAWEMFGLSMASWNAVVSFGLAAIWILAMRKRAG
ncbi:MAG: disulfide bond formation protein B [Rhodobacteraceae bacterium]|nr:disulfide bond formation protein B [Alphaproteobacteria bacterium]MBT8475172.1 disulfide bond formation protein B [Alphaproteobacteria bacterium]NNF71869.1 disulfide bond formation protein B [Paracoccaceae bacterium]NNK66662.1 disulfide bond formation protein B [Paracoccaceae bacterium]